MATPEHVRTSTCPSTVRPGRALAALGLATVTALALLPGGTSTAAPAPSIAEVEAKTQQLTHQVDVAVEDYQEAQVELGALRRRADAAQARVQAEQEALTALQGQVGDVVAAAYRTGGSAAVGFSLLTGSTSARDYLDKATSLDLLAADQADRMSVISTTRSRLAAAQVSAATDVEAQRAVERRAAERRTVIERTLQEQRDLLAQLKAEERARLEAARRAQAAREAEQARVARAAEQARAARAAAERASRSRTAQPATAARRAPAAAAAPDAPAPARPSGGSDSGRASGRAGTAVAEAYRRLGTPYQWAGSGPGTFDCSGLTAWVWAKAGVSLPHSSRAQYAGGRKVSQSQVQPGDLVFFGSPIHHVGIYVGGGNMISAPHTGDVVKVQPAFRGDYVGAVRP